jgi:hypothetical protein
MSRSRKKFMKASMYKRGGTSRVIQNGMKEDCKQKSKCKNLPGPSQKYRVQNVGCSHHPTYVAPDFETSCYVKDNVNLAQRLKDNGIFFGGA